MSSPWSTTPRSSSSYSGSESDNDFNYDEIKKKLLALQKLLESKYKKLGNGAFRACYEYNDTQVIKCPTNRQVYGISDTSIYCNLVEYEVYQVHKQKRIMPKTSLIWMMDIPLIVMDKVKMHNLKSGDYEKFNAKLKKYDISLQDGYYQLGKTATGKVVCADMGNEDDLISRATRKAIENHVREIYEKLEVRKKINAKFFMKRLKLLLS